MLRRTGPTGSGCGVSVRAVLVAAPVLRGRRHHTIGPLDVALVPLVWLPRCRPPHQQRNPRSVFRGQHTHSLQQFGPSGFVGGRPLPIDLIECGIIVVAVADSVAAR